jgi:hypothetical protein
MGVGVQVPLRAPVNQYFTSRYRLAVVSGCSNCAQTVQANCGSGLRANAQTRRFAAASSAGSDLVGFGLLHRRLAILEKRPNCAFRYGSQSYFSFVHLQFSQSSFFPVTSSGAPYLALFARCGKNADFSVRPSRREQSLEGLGAGDVGFPTPRPNRRDTRISCTRIHEVRAGRYPEEYAPPASFGPIALRKPGASCI